MSLPATPGTVIASHRYPWKIVEIVSLAIVTALGVLIAAVAQPILLGLSIIAVGVGYTAVTARRKNRSLLELADRDGTWTLIRNHVPATGRGAQARFADVTRIDMSTTTGGGRNVVLSTEESEDHSAELLVLPERLARQDAIYGKLVYTAGQPHVTVTRAARAFLGLTDAYDTLTR